MSADEHGSAAAGAPLEKEIHVACSREHAFAVFTSRIDTWWPRGHRRFGASELLLEPFVGGRFFERAANGEEFDLGAVRIWEAPDRVCYSWRPGTPMTPTEVEVRFIAEGSSTRVCVTHRSGSTCPKDAFVEKVALYERAWGHVLAALSEALRS